MVGQKSYTVKQAAEELGISYDAAKKICRQSEAYKRQKLDEQEFWSLF